MIYGCLQSSGSGMSSCGMFPGLAVRLPSYRVFCVVAVCQSSGAFGVGMCPGLALHHLLGLPGLGVVHFYSVENTSFSVRPAPGGVGWCVEGGKRIEGKK